MFNRGNEYLGFCVSFVVSLHCHGVATADRPVRCEGGPGTIHMLALSPDGKFVAAGGREPVVRLWDTSDGSEIRSIPLYESPQAEQWLTALAFSPDGKELAVAARGEPIRFVDPSTGGRIDGKIPIEVHTAVYDLAYSPNGTKLAIADGRSLRIWDNSLQQQVQQIDLPKSERVWRIAEIAFSPDGKSIAAAMQDFGGRVMKKVPRLRLWDVESGETLFDVWEVNGWDSAVAISVDGKLVAETGRGYPGRTHVWKEFPGAVFVWNMATKQLQYRVPADKAVTTCLAFSPDGKFLATGGNDSSVKIWNPANGKAIKELSGHDGQIIDLAFSQDGRKLTSLDTENVVLIWSLDKMN